MEGNEGVANPAERDPLLPKVVVLQECTARITDIRTLEGGYRVCVLPDEIRQHFTAGAHIVIVESKEFADSMPDLGGSPSGNGPLPFHMDLDKKNLPMHVLTLWQTITGERGASTVAITPDVGAHLLKASEDFFTSNRESIGKERAYDTRFNITKEEYEACFDSSNGYEEAVKAMAGEHADERRMLALRLSLLGYLVRGASAHELMRIQMEATKNKVVRMKYDRPMVVFYANANLLHGRDIDPTPEGTPPVLAADTVRRLYCE